MQQLMREGCSYTYPPLSIARYSFIQMSELEHYRLKKLPKDLILQHGIRTRILVVESPKLYTSHCDILPDIKLMISHSLPLVLQGILLFLHLVESLVVGVNDLFVLLNLFRHFLQCQVHSYVLFHNGDSVMSTSVHIHFKCSQLCTSFLYRFRNVMVCI